VSGNGFTLAQLLFSIALGVVSAGIVAFAVYVVSTTFRSSRWFRRNP